MRVAKQLEEHGYLVGTIRPPTVPQDSARLRVSFKPALGDEAMQVLVKIITSLS